MADKATEDNLASNSDQDDQSEMVTKSELNRILNSAISNRLKSFDKKFDELMSRLTPKEPESESQQDNDGTKFNKQEFLTLKKQLDQVTKEREAEKQKNKNSRLKSALSDALQKAGVNPPMMKAAQALLMQEGLIAFNDSEDIVFKNEYEELDLESGIQSWAKSEDGKAFLPPKRPVGSGDRKYQTKGSPAASNLESDIVSFFQQGRFEE